MIGVMMSNVFAEEKSEYLSEKIKTLSVTIREISSSSIPDKPYVHYEICSGPNALTRPTVIFKSDVETASHTIDVALNKLSCTIRYTQIAANDPLSISITLEEIETEKMRQKIENLTEEKKDRELEKFMEQYCMGDEHNMYNNANCSPDEYDYYLQAAEKFNNMPSRADLIPAENYFTQLNEIQQKYDELMNDCLYSSALGCESSVDVWYEGKMSALNENCCNYDVNIRTFSTQEIKQHSVKLMDMIEEKVQNFYTRSPDSAKNHYWDISKTLVHHGKFHTWKYPEWLKSETLSLLNENHRNYLQKVNAVDTSNESYDVKSQFELQALMQAKTELVLSYLEMEIYEHQEILRQSDEKIPPQVESGGGCLIATAAFGSEMAPQVQFLRELRDNTVLQTTSGTTFMNGFNQFYYSFSPQIADYERENPVFKEAVKVTLTPMLTSLTLLNYVDVDTEEEMLGYGIGIILLNIGMYFVAPAVLIVSLKKRLFI